MENRRNRLVSEKLLQSENSDLFLIRVVSFVEKISHYLSEEYDPIARGEYLEMANEILEDARGD